MSYSHLSVIALVVLFIGSPLLLALTSLQQRFLLSSISQENNSIILFALLNAVLIVAALLFWENKNKDTRYINRELAKQIKKTVEEIKQKQK